MFYVYFFQEESIGRGPSVVRTLWGMPIGIDKDNQWEQDKKCHRNFQINIWHALCVFFYQESIGMGPSVVRTFAALDLKTLTTHLLDSTWLALTTPMGMP